MPAFINAKLVVGEVNDPLEQEADRVADQVMRMPIPPETPLTKRAGSLEAAVSSAPPRLQRFSGQSNGQIGAAPPSVDHALAGPNRPLDPALRQDMEQRFGHDFSRVRVHSGAAAEQSAQDMNAQAYSVGHSIVFDAGQFAPGTHAGRRLIAHELTHVVQQSGTSSCTVRRQVDPQHTQGTGDPPSLFTILVADPHKRSDKRFARQQGQADAARIQENGALSPEDRQLVNAKLRFFEGDAKKEYTRQIRPTLVSTTQPEIEMPLVYVGKVPDAEPSEKLRIRRRRQNTLRFFAKVKDYQLERAYVSRLQRYLDEGLEANPYLDVEMIEQIIAERAPNAPWHEAARQDFLAKREVKLRALARGNRLTTLSPYWQNQFGALAEQTQDWPDDERAYARDLLWIWNEHVSKFDNNPYIRDVQAAARKLVINNIVKLYELELRHMDRSIQDECKGKNRDWLMNVWGDPCKPWFGGTSHRGEHYLQEFETRMNLLADEKETPYRNIVFWLKEHTRLRNALPSQMGEIHLEMLQSWSVVQGAMVMASKPIGKPAVSASIQKLSTLKSTIRDVAEFVEAGADFAAMFDADFNIPRIGHRTPASRTPRSSTPTSHPIPPGSPVLGSNDQTHWSDTPRVIPADRVVGIYVAEIPGTAGDLAKVNWVGGRSAEARAGAAASREVTAAAEQAASRGAERQGGQPPVAQTDPVLKVSTASAPAGSQTVPLRSTYAPRGEEAVGAFRRRALARPFSAKGPQALPVLRQPSKGGKSERPRTPAHSVPTRDDLQQRIVQLEEVPIPDKVTREAVSRSLDRARKLAETNLVAAQRLVAALEAKLAGQGETLDPATRSALAGEERLPDEGFDEASRTITPDDLREYAQAQRPLPTAREVQMLQRVVDEVSTRLMFNPEEAATWLSPGERAAAEGSQQVTGMQFGNAVERAVAAELGDRTNLARFLHTPQRRFVSTPDIAGPIGRQGSRNFDVTTKTRRAEEGHNQRWYGPFTQLVTYPSLPQGWRFPPLD